MTGVVLGKALDHRKHLAHILCFSSVTENTELNRLAPDGMSELLQSSNKKNILFTAINGNHLKPGNIYIMPGCIK